MRRREFLGLVGCAAITWPLAARAQQQARPSIGFIHSASPDYFATFAKDFHAGLREAGYIEGQNVTIESR
jgi:putative ABC transport system substrate-binding protein